MQSGVSVAGEKNADSRQRAAAEGEPAAAGACGLPVIREQQCA